MRKQSLFIQQNVFPSPLTEDVIMFCPSTFSFIQILKEERIALKDSDKADFGLSNTANSGALYLIPQLQSKEFCQLSNIFRILNGIDKKKTQSNNEHPENNANT
jgi:hypothetical protein